MTQTTMPESGTGLWPTKTIRVGGVTITVERATVGHSRIKMRVLAELPPADDGFDTTLQGMYARFVAQSVQVDGLEPPLPSIGDGPQAIRDGFEQFMQMDTQIVDAWLSALDDVDRPYGPDDLLPTHRLPEDARKNPLSAGSRSKRTSGAS